MMVMLLNARVRYLIDVRGVAVLLLALALAGPPVRAEGEEGAAEAAAPPSRQVVDAAIARGVAYIRAEQKSDGTWTRDAGATGLALYALAHAGAKPDDPAVNRGVAALLRSLVRPGTYEASLAIMAFATIDPEKWGKVIARLARLLEMAQCRNGQWSYKLRPGRSGGDNSNTQFAILALWYSRRAGVEVKKETFERCRRFFAETQNEDGGWGYSAKERSKSYGSMTATGLSVLVVCRAGAAPVRAEEERARAGPEVARAVGWLTKNLVLDRNPEAKFRLGGGRAGGARKVVGDSFWRHYWLWSLERAATLSAVKKLGSRDWYAEGARHLVDAQRKDGSWVGSESPFQATAFAVLFLTRSSKRMVATEPPLPEGATTPTPR